jgi:large subunit ribosomal protein L10
MQLAISRERKEALVAEYIDLLTQSKGVIISEFRGMVDTEFKKVRRAVREVGGIHRVTKLTLLKRALQESGFPVPAGLEGAPVAITFCFEDVPAVAKALKTYLKTSELMILRGGLMGQSVLTPAEVSAIADLPPLDVLRAQILGLLDAPAANLVGVLQAGMAQVINVINARIEKG